MLLEVMVHWNIPSFYFHAMQALQQASLPVSGMGQLIMASSPWDNSVRVAEGRARQANKQLSRVESGMAAAESFPPEGEPGGLARKQVSRAQSGDG